MRLLSAFLLNPCDLRGRPVPTGVVYTNPTFWWAKNLEQARPLTPLYPSGALAVLSLLLSIATADCHRHRDATQPIPTPYLHSLL